MVRGLARRLTRNRSYWTSWIPGMKRQSRIGLLGQLLCERPGSICSRAKPSFAHAQVPLKHGRHTRVVFCRIAAPDRIPGMPLLLCSHTNGPQPAYAWSIVLLPTRLWKRIESAISPASRIRPTSRCSCFDLRTDKGSSPCVAPPNSLHPVATSASPPFLSARRSSCISRANEFASTLLGHRSGPAPALIRLRRLHRRRASSNAHSCVARAHSEPQRMPALAQRPCPTPLSTSARARRLCRSPVTQYRTCTCCCSTAQVLPTHTFQARRVGAAKRERTRGQASAGRSGPARAEAGGRSGPARRLAGRSGAWLGTRAGGSGGAASARR
jgi:hypothetical protein